MLGVSLDLMGFGTWRRILGFRLFLWFVSFRLESLGPKGGVLTRDLAEWLL